MKKRKSIIILWSVLILVMVVSLFIFLNMNDRSSIGNNQNSNSENETDLGSIEDVLNQNNEDLLELVDTRKTVIFAIYGTDERSDETGRSDIIMVLMYDPIQEKMVMASLPRDLRVNVPGYGLDKINHAYAYGGRELIDQTIEELLGIKLDFSVKLDFDTFASIIEATGGVNIIAQKLPV